VELLVTVSAISLLMSIMIPVAARTRLLARVTVVNAELRQIGLALHAYGLDHRQNYPPVRWDCGNKENYYQLPRELSKYGYLPEGKEKSGRSSSVTDRFNRPSTYKYMAVGAQFGNNDMPFGNLQLWVPDGFPDNEKETGKYYDDPRTSPVTWVVYSTGPDFDSRKMREMKYPVPTKTWFDADKRQGIIIRLRTKSGRQTGSFDIK